MVPPPPPATLLAGAVTTPALTVETEDLLAGTIQPSLKQTLVSTSGVTCFSRLQLLVHICAMKNGHSVTHVLIKIPAHATLYKFKNKMGLHFWPILYLKLGGKLHK